MPRTLEERIANLEKVISDFFGGSRGMAKRSGTRAKRKSKAGRSVNKGGRKRKSAKRRRTA